MFSVIIQKAKMAPHDPPLLSLNNGVIDTKAHWLPLGLLDKPVFFKRNISKIGALFPVYFYRSLYRFFSHLLSTAE
jgi:hypothetical protein